MDTRRGTQRLSYAPTKRRRRGRRRRYRLKPWVKDTLYGILGGIILATMLILGFYFDDPVEAEIAERRYYMNDTYYYTDYEDYLQACAERDAYKASEAAAEQEEIGRIQSSETETTDSLIGSRDWGSEDSEILLQIAMAEAEGESVEGKALVMLVVLNRVWSDGFPDTIEEVVMEEGQFATVTDGGRYYTTEPDAGCYEALEMVMDGWDESQGALYFESVDNEDDWHATNLEFLYQVGNHRFYK